jgi:hypothetical protein
MQYNQTCAFAQGYFWGIRAIIRKPHLICAVILVKPCFIQVHDIIPCFLKARSEGLIDDCDLVFLAKSKDGDTGTCFIQKIYAPSSSLLQGKYLPLSPSPLRLNIFRLLVILSLTQLYRYTL